MTAAPAGQSATVGQHALPPQIRRALPCRLNRRGPAGRAALRQLPAAPRPACRDAAGEIAAAFDITRTAVSQHLTVLKQAGLLSERRDGTRRLYRARPQGLAGLREFLDDLWGGALDTARRLAEAERALDDERAAVG